MVNNHTFRVLWRSKTDNSVTESTPVIADWADRAREDWENYQRTGNPTTTNVWIHEDEAELHFENVAELWVEPAEAKAR